MNTIKRCTSLLVIAVLCTACSSGESAQPQIQSDAEVYDGTVHFDVLSIGTDNETYSSARVNITNYADHAVYDLQCDSYGFQSGVLVAREDSQDMFARVPGSPELEPGQTRAAQLIMKNDTAGIAIDSVEWVCTYQEGNEFNLIMFEGRS